MTTDTLVSSVREAIATRSLETDRERLRYCNSYSRLPTLLDLWALGGQSWANWLRLLGEQWQGCDNIGRYADDLWDTPLSDVLETGNGREFLMTDEELAAYAALPDRVTVYRGCYLRNKWGLSWTLERDVAASFPMLNRYQQEGPPLLVKATAEKSRIAAVKLDRKEHEIITHRPKHVSTSHIR